MNDFDDNSYLLVLIIMILSMVIFGRAKKNREFIIEYNPQNYQYLNSLTIFEKELQKYNSKNFDFIKITNEVDLSACLIPNIVDIFFINIKPHKYFDIRKEIKDFNSNIMVVYNHNIFTDNNDYFTSLTFQKNKLFMLLDRNKECIKNICNNYGYFYEITKKISILDIYPIFNDSKNTVNITIFIIKKSFWHY
jgi:hypothetical protein